RYRKINRTVEIVQRSVGVVLVAAIRHCERHGAAFCPRGIVICRPLPLIEICGIEAGKLVGIKDDVGEDTRAAVVPPVRLARTVDDYMSHATLAVIDLATSLAPDA